MNKVRALKRYVERQAKKKAKSASSKAVASVLSEMGFTKVTNEVTKPIQEVAKIVSAVEHPVKTVAKELGVNKAIKNAVNITGELGIDDAIKAIEEPIKPLSDTVKGVEKEDDRQYSEAIRNTLKSMRARAREGESKETRALMRESLDNVEQLLDSAIDSKGYKFTYIALKNWNGNFEGELIRLVAAIYDDEYNPKPHNKDNIARGKQAYENALRSLADKLDIDKDSIEGGFESLVMRFE